VGYFAIMLNMRLIAEGIETEAELATLRSLGIDYGQGYLLGRPEDGKGRDPWPATIVSEGLGGPIRFSPTTPTLAETWDPRAPE
jgi:EAL domain-containing protein (putative c-di-GMP-specific phosphodiesterase class I)